MLGLSSGLSEKTESAVSAAPSGTVSIELKNTESNSCKEEIPKKNCNFKPEVKKVKCQKKVGWLKAILRVAGLYQNKISGNLVTNPIQF